MVDVAKSVPNAMVEQAGVFPRLPGDKGVKPVEHRMNKDAPDHDQTPRDRPCSRIGQPYPSSWNRWYAIALLTYVAISTCIFGQAAAAEGANEKSLSNYGALREEILNAIGASKQRVWIATNFLTDGEIVTALFLAKYRKIDTKVMVDSSRVNHYMSRVSDLKRNNIPVFLLPDHFAYAKDTYILTDNKGYKIDADLNHAQTKSIYLMTSLPANESARFAVTFEKALDSSKAVVVKPVPLVGKAGGRGRGSAYRPNGDAKKPKDGSYNYDTMSSAGKGKIPAGIAKKLPKDTIYQKRQRQAVHEALSKPATAGTDTSPTEPKAPIQDDSRRDTASPPTSTE